MKNVKLFLGILLIGAFVLLTGNTVFAKTKLEQATPTQTGVTVKWNVSAQGGGKNSETTNGYELRCMKYADYMAAGGITKFNALTPVKLAPEVTQYSLKNLAPGTKYMVKVTRLYKDKKGAAASEEEKLEVYTAPGKVANLKKGEWNNETLQNSFNWEKQDACTYEWEVLNNAKAVFASGKTNGETSATVTGLSATMCYMVHVRACVKDPVTHQDIKGEWSDGQYLFGQPIVAKVARGKSTIKVYWKKIQGVSSYKVYISTKQHKSYKSGTTKKIKASKKYATVKKYRGKKISKKKAYYVYVVATKKVGTKTWKSTTVYTWKVAKKSNKITKVSK